VTTTATIEHRNNIPTMQLLSGIPGKDGEIHVREIFIAVALWDTIERGMKMYHVNKGYNKRNSIDEL
jgi:hypothetical protein